MDIEKGFQREINPRVGLGLFLLEWNQDDFDDDRRTWMTLM